jgi:cytochrome c oxidase subunit 4
MKPQETPHATVGTYLKVAVILTILTILEVSTFFFQKEFGPALIPTLLILAASKFLLVVLFYMHLKFDSRLFAGLFAFGFAVESGLLIALLVLFAFR